MRSRTELIRTLAVYKQARNQLIADFVQEEPELYHTMFEFKPSSTAMRLAIERHIVLWLMQHANLYQKLYLNGSDAESSNQHLLFVQFIKNYHKYCKGFLSSRKGGNEVEFIFSYDLLKSKIGFLDDLLEIDQSANARLKKIRYQSVKAKAFYERQSEELRRRKDASGNTR